MAQSARAVEIAERDTRRNAALLVLDYSAFGVGMAFLGMTTVLPNLVRLLGGTPLVVGSLAAIQTGTWFLPQLVAGRYVANRPRVKKYVLGPIAIGRSLLALQAPLLLLCAVRRPGLALGALLTALAVFWLADGLSSVPWYDLVARAIPAERRGRVLGSAQSLSGLLGIGVGALIRGILARPNRFPVNHVLLVQLAAVCLGVSFLALALIREAPSGVASAPRPGWGDYLPRLRAICRTDPRFVWVVGTRWLSGLADMGAAFYVLFAADRLHMPQATIGLFVSAGVTGSLLSGIILGPLGDRHGRQRVIAIVMGLRCLCPALALFAPLLAGLHPWVGPAMLALAFAAAGMANSGSMVGFTNYVLEIAPPGERSTYMGLANTLTGILIAAPVVAGWLVQAASYELLFAVALGVAALGLAAALRGPRLSAEDL